ncbi:hypothetical protein BXZ70DRAFT_1004648 [Cristinia sonorae]|uniref:BTB domain-containing protein n=1 Tax=Cristinia sonorae TaxID=1940300 RepID=A0A8K0UW49_9AGAR|nr:hypothetical protein BXZ70DRAFT_1004648 [Cristinia sonorae]
MSTPAAAPFDETAQADVILRSSDKVDFHVLKVILSLSSIIFRDMFELAGTESSSLSSSSIDSNTNKTVQSTLPVVEISENGDTVDAILRIIYPTTDDCFPTKIPLICAMLEAGRKYELSRVSTIAAQCLSSAANTSPIVVYAIACRYGMDDIVRTAAVATLRLPILQLSSDDEELKRISAHTFVQLLEFRRQCALSASAFAASSNNRILVEFWGNLEHGHTCSNGCSPIKVRSYNSRPRYLTVYIPQWWSTLQQQYSDKLKETMWDEETAKAELIDVMSMQHTCLRCRELSTSNVRRINNFVRFMSEGIQRKRSELLLQFKFGSETHT